MHFYEDFLGAYDPKLRELRGVYYTPEPVVSYIVRSVDRLLRDEFGLADGLADTGTVEVATEDGEARTSPRVLILDPAAGTGTFLREVVSRVRRTIADKGLGGAWPDYVREHLLPRLFGFELLMAPYVICHLKLAIEIGGDQGAFAMPEGERLNVFLTNSLEEAREGATGPMFAAEIAREAREADAVKCDHPVMVVIGNPPYSGHSANRGEWIRDLIGAYKQGIPELRKPGQAKWLSDDYVKFIRFAQWRTGRPASRETRRIEATTGATCAGDCSPPSQPLPKPAMRPHRRGTRPADPERERLLRGKRRDRGVLVAVVLALEAHGLASPEAGRDLDHLVGLRAGPTRPAAGRDPLGRDLGADAEGGQQPPVAEEVDRRALHREHHRSRSGRTTTLIPNLSRSVAPASAAIVLIASSCGCGEISRSDCQIESMSHSSQSSTHSRKARAEANGNAAMPSPMRALIAAPPCPCSRVADLGARRARRCGWSLSLEESICLTSEGGKACLDHVPDQTVIDIGVSVNKHVAKGDDALVTADPGGHRLIDPGESRHCLADDLELTLHGGPQHRIPLIVGERLVVRELS